MIRHGLVGTVAVIGAICAASYVVAQDNPPSLAGRWHGTIDVPGGALPFSVTFATPSGELAGTIDVKAHKASPLGAISLTGHNIDFELQNAKPSVAVFDGTIQRDSMGGTFTQGRARGTFSLRRVDAVTVPATAALYRSEDVTFANGSVTLAGTVTTPQGKGPFRALVMVTGSGAKPGRGTVRVQDLRDHCGPPDAPRRRRAPLRRSRHRRIHHSLSTLRPNLSGARQ